MAEVSTGPAVTGAVEHRRAAGGRFRLERIVLAAAGESDRQPDRWMIVPLNRADEPSASEIETLRLVAAMVAERLAGCAAAPRRAPERPLLSRRERECLQWTAAGKTTWEIAAILEISPNTIDGYIASATRKLGAVNRTQAVAEALRRALID